jgi:membrane protease YdiL (CAAX protease family)
VIAELKALNRKAFSLLLAAGLLGVIAIMPFVLELVHGHAFRNVPPPEIPIPAIVALSLVQNSILLTIMIAFGMVFAKRVGLQMPLISAWATGGPAPAAGKIMWTGILGGVLAGAALVALEKLLFLNRLPGEMLALFDIPLWKRLLAGVVYGGITEELLMRLFLMSATAWLLGRWFKAPDGKPAPAAFWGAIILVALLFGLGHLPATAAITPLTPLLAVRALLLNGVAGVAFGYLYWRRGLEAAMLGHMSTHLILQVPGVMLFKSFQP